MEKTVERRVSQKRGQQKAVLGPREKRRLCQLGVCAALFLAVFFAKGTDRLPRLRGELADTLSRSADFRSAFADLGWSVANGQPVADTLGDLWTEVFLAQEKAAVTLWQGGPLYQSVQKDLNRGTVTPVRFLRAESTENIHESDPMTVSKTLSPIPDQATTVQEPESSSAQESQSDTEPTVVYVEYTGPALPDNATMDRYALGLTETVSPVLAPLTSGFGWREHPIDGGEKFHQGVDLAVNTGTPVLAFAAGTVDYIGESDIYGQYLQLRHAGGVTSFYAHCSKLCVQQGQQVQAGEKVAESGATGHVTGPHLHFELKRDGVRLNPAYYIQTLA